MNKIDKEIEPQVAAIVAGLLNEKEEEVLRKKMEDELTKAAATISELTTELENKNKELTDSAAVLTSKDAEVASTKAELEAVQAELTTTKASLDEKTVELSNMLKDIAAEKRMSELESAGVAHTDKKQEQSSKVREMSDDEFSTYKSELSSIREAIIKEIEADKKQKEEADAKASEVAAKAAEEAAKAAAEAANNNNDGVTEPANVTPGHMAMAALNMEFVPSDDVMAKYSDLGKAMAEMWKKS